MLPTQPALTRTLVLVALILSMSAAVHAQLPFMTNTTSTPIPDAGHNYIKSPIETINPANGSVSIRIGVKVPPARALTVPFSFAYDSNGSFYFGTGPGGAGLGYWTTTGVPFTQGGWSYSIPLLSYQLANWSQAYFEGNGKTYTCTGGQGFVFQDLQGNRHDMDLTVAPTHVPGGGAGDTCGGLQGGSVGPLLAVSGVPPFGYQPLPPVTVTDGEGTVYNFTNALNNNSQTISSVPSTIVDRNGNTVTLSAGANSGTYTDTAGRQALSFSNFGGNDTVIPSGQSQGYQVFWTPVSANFNMSVTNICSGGGLCGTCPTSMSASSSAVSKIILPNGQQFTFSYDPTYGVLTKITYPSGGYVRYVWGLNTQSESGEWILGSDPTTTHFACNYDVPAITDRYVSYDGTTEVLHQNFAYTTNLLTGGDVGWSTKQTTVTTYDLVRGTNFQTIYTYVPGSGDLDPSANPDGGLLNLNTLIPVEQSIQYRDISGSMLRNVAKTWCNIRELCSVQTTLDDNSASRTNYSYNANEQETERDEYGFGNGSSGSIARITVTNYASFTPHIVTFPSSIITYDANVNRVAETDYAYDQSTPQPTSGIVQHQSGLNAGNLTTETRWLNTGGSSPVTSFAYNDTGQVVSETDPNGNTTTYSYTDSFSAGTPPGPTNAYLTRITQPAASGVAHVENYAYSYADGRMTSSTDQNGQATSYHFNDTLDRLTEIDYPDAGQTLVTYNDGGTNPSIVISKLISSGNYLTAKTVMDGVGQPIQTQLTSDPSGVDYTDTTYDGLGNVYTQSNPYRSTSDPTYGISTSTYDPLGRITQLAHPDGSTLPTSYYGPATEVCDEGNGTNRVCRISQTDGLGRLTSVCEVTSTTLIGNGGTPSACGQSIAATGFLTSYQYDALGNLLQINQGTLNPRTFTYDSLSRLLTANNPESGLQSYAYDAASNVISKTSPAPNQTNPAVTHTLTYCYDQLNRLTSKSYSAQSCPMPSPDVTYTYDVASAHGIANLANTVGRLTGEGNANSWIVNSYDQMGRTSSQWQCQPYSCTTEGSYALGYQYDKLGDITSLSTADSGITYFHSYDGAAHLSTTTSSLTGDSKHPGTLFTSGVYNAAGQLTSALFGNGVAEIRTYDNRLRLTSITDGSIYNSSVNYAPNSDILSSTDSVNGNSTYSYDDFNRMTSSNNCQDVYDRYGNRWQANGSCWSNPSFSFSQNNNRMDGFSYDAAGNVLARQNHTYTYDAENRITAVDGGSLSNYVYDAEGRRAANTNWTVGPVEYFYDLQNREIDMTWFDGSNRWNDREYAFAGDRQIATYFGGDTIFNHTDWVGTIRRATASDGSVYENSLNASPWGEGGWNPNSQGDPSLLHFTGKEGDDEDGLVNFGARYYDPNQPRFMSADWADKPEAVPYSDLADPQSLNLYTYVHNNPVSRTDKDGHDELSELIGVGKELYNQVASLWNWNLNYSGKSCCDLIPHLALKSASNTDERIGMIATSVALLLIPGAGEAESAEEAAKVAEVMSESKAFAEAAEGGKNSGFLTNYLTRSEGEISNGIKSLDEGIAEHEDKIANPAKYDKNWATKSEKEQQGLINKWSKEVQNKNDQKQILQGIKKIKHEQKTP